MKTILTIVMGALLLASSASESHAQSSAESHSILNSQGFGDAANWFCNMQGGLFWLNNVNFNTIFPGLHKFETKRGWGASWDIMHNLNSARTLALGFTIGYYRAQMASLVTPAGASFGATGNFSMIPLMLTMIYQKEFLDRLSFFAGLSWGLMYRDFDISAPPSGLNYDSQRGFNFAAGARAGVAIRLTQHLNFIATYQFLKGFSTNGGYDGHAVLFGLSIPWGSPR